MRHLYKTLYFCSFILAVSCSHKVIPLQREYQNKPYSFSVGESKDQVWESLIRELTSKGLAIVTIDKNSGLITTDKTSFLNAYSYESNSGNLIDSNALVVCTKVRGPYFSPSFKPTVITGQWAVLVKQTEERTMVDIRLANASGFAAAEGSNTYKDQVTSNMQHLIVRSTGVFEKSIEEAVR